MLGYATFGTNNMEKALAYYDALLAEVGAKHIMEIRPTFHLYGKDGGTSMLAICAPHDEQAATPGNGTMIAIPCESQDQVNAAHAKALELGGTDEGAPGERGQGFYGAYCRDLDGNKLCFYKLG